MTNTIKASVLVDICNSLSVNNRLRTYSGRGMYGKYCPAIEFDSMSDVFEFFFSLGEWAAEQAQYEDGGEEPEMEVHLVRKFAGGASTDSMGMGIVVYWSRWELEGELPEDDDEY